ncbi:MAG: hypothetical protein KH382_08525 [Clostridiales bacterium]|jgi:lipoprotein|nr:hypothetical protein [Clostridiales bacterium]
MKKRIMSAAILLCLFLTLVSCGKGDVYLELAAFGESFRAENREMFPNDACEHYVRYRDASSVSQDVDASVYHYAYCIWGSCDYEAHYEVHTVKLSTIRVDYASQAKENGYYYHEVCFSCKQCGENIRLYVLCKTQLREETCDPRTGVGCLDDVDWREFLCDTPYAISDD